MQSAAQAEGLSLNRYCARKLSAPSDALAGLDDAAQAVEGLSRRFGEQLLAVAVYGSWARGQATDGSDVDVLVVLEDTVPITRKLYRDWDREALSWQGRIVEPHFVHLPLSGSVISGLFAEVAVDGIVLFERSLRLSRYLVTVRREIAEGRIVRRWVHGQPYWSEAA